MLSKIASIPFRTDFPGGWQDKKVCGLRVRPLLHLHFLSLSLYNNYNNNKIRLTPTHTLATGDWDGTNGGGAVTGFGTGGGVGCVGPPSRGGGWVPEGGRFMYGTLLIACDPAAEDMDNTSVSCKAFSSCTTRHGSRTRHHNIAGTTIMCCCHP